MVREWILCMSESIWLTWLLFTLTYVGLALGKVPGLRMDRAGIALVGATLMLVTGVLSLSQAVSPASIYYETLLLLFGMMVVVGYLRLAGFFGRLTHSVLDQVRNPLALLAITIVLSGVLSAFLVNDIVCLALAPLVLYLTRRLRCHPLPHLIGLVTAANIGSVGTITGNPQNMMIGVQSHIPYLRFAGRLLPVAVLGLAIDFLVVAWVYRRHLLLARAAYNPGEVKELPASEEEGAPNGWPHNWLLAKGVAVTLGAVALFFAGLPIATVALGAAAVLLLGRVRPEKVYQQVEWNLLVMFAGLFVVVHAFKLYVVSRWDLEEWRILSNHPVSVLSLVSAGLSNLVSNVPAVLLFEPVVRAMPSASQETAWLALAMSSTFAGNLTVVGSVANLIVVENARREGVTVSFWAYCRVGVPVTVLTLLLGMGWLHFIVY